MKTPDFVTADADVDSLIWTGTEFLTTIGGQSYRSATGLTWELLSDAPAGLSNLQWNGREVLARNGGRYYVRPAQALSPNSPPIDILLSGSLRENERNRLARTQFGGHGTTSNEVGQALADVFSRVMPELS